jgi:hypothetical protein
VMLINSSAKVLFSGIYFMCASSDHIQPYNGGSNFTMILWEIRHQPLDLVQGLRLATSSYCLLLIHVVFCEEHRSSQYAKKSSCRPICTQWIIRPKLRMYESFGPLPDK